MSDQERPSRKTIVLCAVMCFLAAGLLGAMHLGMSQPFNGVAMRGHVMTLDQLREFSRTDATGFMLPVFVTWPTEQEYWSGQVKAAFYLEPGDEVWVTGIMYDRYQILRGNQHFWVDRRFIKMEGE